MNRLSVRHPVFGAALAAGLLMTLMHAPPAAGASPDDTARVLAGMEVPATSPLARLTREGSWQRHANRFDKAWARLEKRQLSKIRAWTSEHIPQRKPVVFYMFSGPDFLYADAFFPDAETYVLSGLEPVGPIPELEGLSRGRLARELGELQRSVNSVLSFSFFITKKMKRQLRGGQVRGTLPILYLFLARSGKTIKDVSLVELDEEGNITTGSEAAKRSRAKGVKISFTGKGDKTQTLYYFSTNVSNGDIKRSGFLRFCTGLGRGDSLLKSASYLMHSDWFSTVRNFVLDQSDVIVQDDSGIPLRYFKRDEWKLYPFGNYLRPIRIFPRKYQRDLRALYHEGRTRPIDFGIGYRWRPRQSNLLLAVRGERVTQQDH